MTDDGIDLGGTVTALDGERPVYVAHARQVNGPAIAALPERIRRMDAVRDYAERCLDHDSNMHPEDVIAILRGEA